MMTDPEFLAAFESQRISQADWTHRAHIRAAYLMIRAHGPADALTRMRDGIKLLNKSHGLVETPDSGYHETLTVVWVRLVNAMISTRGPGADGTFESFAKEQPHLLCSSLPRMYYSPAGMTKAARYEFVEPDLAPLPVCTAERSQTK
jgi:hypothetical protein